MSFFYFQLWYFERVGLMSHVAALILHANVGLNENEQNSQTGDSTRIDSSWAAADERNVSIKTKWDNPRLHDEVVLKISVIFIHCDSFCVLQ